MKKPAPAPDLFADQPVATDTPKRVFTLPRTHAELVALRAHVWEITPVHLRGVINGKQCRWQEALWIPLDTMLGIELLDFTGPVTGPL